ncbi:MAG: 2-oxo acid dehydrogenase subunit E2 [Candidatus Tectomicrobia bacterium]|nr:2-oxo acid dehydrogenase subunit E2 [Candidatus Tectomicrobia bacterium]
MHQAKITMPRMGTSVHEGTIVQWLKKEGDPLTKGEPVLLAESEKVEFEVESPYDGRLAKILVPAETAVPVGQALAVIETEEPVPVEEEGAPAEESAAVPASSSGPSGRPAAAARRERPGKFLSPRVRSLARDYGIPLDEVEGVAGTGRDGRVTEEDLRAYLADRKAKAGMGAEAAPDAPALVFPPPENADVLPLSRLRKRLSQRLTASVKGVPQFTTFDEADVTEIVNQRKARGEAEFARKGIHLTYTHFLAWAALRALERTEFHPLNARFGGDVIYLFRHIHLGIAAAVPEGLVVPVIREAETLSFEKLARRIQDMADRARQGALSPADVAGSTFTISNAGIAGSIYATPIINPPEAAILGVGAIQKRVVPLEDGSIGVRDRMGVSLSVDHRMVDGMLAAQFNRAVCENLENFDFSVLD